MTLTNDIGYGTRNGCSCQMIYVVGLDNICSYQINDIVL